MAKLTLSFKDKVLKVYNVEPGEIVIGSDPSCQIHIDSLALQPHHAAITTKNRKSVIRDLGSTEGTFVGEARLSAPHPLKQYDIIRIGKHTLLYTTDPSDEFSDDNNASVIPRTGKQQAWLQLLNGPNVGKTISITRKMTNLGKAGVQTAVITRRDEGFFLSHLEGDKEPTVDGQSIGQKSWKLLDGNVIRIGNIKMLFTLA